MIRLYLFFLCIFLLSCGRSNYFKINPDCSDLKRSDLSNTLLFFSLENSPSKEFLNSITSNDSLINFIKANFNFMVLNDSCEAGVSIIEKYTINAFPTIVLTNEKEELIFKNVGITSSENLLKKLSLPGEVREDQSATKSYELNPDCESGLIPSLRNTVIFFDTDIHTEKYMQQLSDSMLTGILANKSLQDYIKSNHNFLVVRNSCELGKDLFKRFQILDKPTFALTNNDEEIIYKTIGYYKNAPLLGWLQKVKRKDISEPNSINSYNFNHPLDINLKLMKELLGTWEVVSGDLKFYKYRLERGDALEFDDYLSFSNDWGWGRSGWKIGAIIKGRNSSSDDFYVTSDDQLIRRDLITKNKAGDLLSYPETVEEKFGIQLKDEMLEISSERGEILLKRIKRSD